MSQYRFEKIDRKNFLYVMNYLNINFMIYYSDNFYCILLFAFIYIYYRINEKLKKTLHKFIQNII